MNNRDLEQKIQELVQQRKRRKRWYKLTAVLAAVAMVVTAGSLILPAMTMEKAPEPLKCQLDLHAHEESCYGDGGELLCGYADFVVHEHDASCYDEEGVLICPLEEIKAHTHSISCYEETRVLTCGMEEGEGHTHNASCYGKSTESTCGFEEKPSHVHTGHIHNSGCYQITRTLTCGQAETHDHTHTSDCYETTTQLICDLDTGCYDEQGNLICGLSEGEGHTHAQDCYPDVLLCGKEEVPAHSHSDACYQVVPELVCGKEEIILHTHTPACYDREGNLICGQIEVREHVHDETCLPAKPETIATPAPSEDGEEVKPSPSPSVEPEGDRSTPAPAIDYEDPEAPQSPAPGQEGEVEASPTPEPEWKPSPAPEPEEEEKSQASPSPAPEEGGEESAYPVVSGSSWAIVTKEESQVKENAVMLFSRLFSFAAPRADGSHDFSENITSATVERQEGGQWTQSDTFTDGDTIRVTLHFTIPAGTITADQSTMHYQLPPGISLSKEETGDVSLTAGDRAGTYTISTRGLITITFDGDFATGDAFAGSLQFQGSVALAEGQGGQEVIFGGAGDKITIVPEKKEYSLRLGKAGIYVKDQGAADYYHHSLGLQVNPGDIIYHLSVFTNDNTDGSDGSITVEDHFTHNPADGNVAYDEGNIVILKGEMNVEGKPVVTPITDYDITYTLQSGNDTASFRIFGLPTLGENEAYEIYYVAKPELDSINSQNGYIAIQNKATAKDKSQEVSDTATVEISKTMVHKEVVVNEGTGNLRWSVYLNEDGRDLSGMTFTDKLLYTVNNEVRHQYNLANLTNLTVYAYTRNDTGDLVNPKDVTEFFRDLIPSRVDEYGTLTIQFPRSNAWPDGADRNAAYHLVYETPPPEGVNPGILWLFQNSIWLGEYTTSATWEGKVPEPSYGVVKNAVWADANNGTNLGYISWRSTISYPANLTEGELEQLQYTDWISDIYYTDSERIINDTHYTTLDTLQESLNVSTAMEVSLQWQEHFSIEVVYADSLADYDTSDLAWDYRDTVFAQFDQNGTTVDIGEIETNGDKPIALFRLRFTKAALEKLRGSQLLYVQYKTVVNRKGLTDGKTVTIPNLARVGDKTVVASVDTSFHAMLTKQVKTDGVAPAGDDFALDSDAYGERAKVNLGDTGGRLYYRILLYNYTDTVELHDNLWEKFGGKVTFDQKLYIYDLTNGEYQTVNTRDYLGSSDRYPGNYTLHNLKNFPDRVIGLYYSIDVSEDVGEGQTNTYTNTVKWGEDLTDSTRAEVTNNKPTLEKASVLDKETGLNQVTYYVVVNPDGRDLDPNSIQLELRDTLTLPPGVSADLLPNTIGLYHYDATNQDGHYLGEKKDFDGFKVEKEEGTGYTYNFILPDEAAVVVVYTYEIDLGSSAAQKITVNNTAALLGRAVISAGDQIQIEAQGSGAQVNRATLRIFKHEAGNQAKVLDDVLFDLFRFEEQEGGGYEWVRTDLTAEGPVADDGGRHFITGGDGVEGAIILNFLDEGTEGGSHYNTLYRLTEYKTLDGYELDKAPRYYVWGEANVTKEETAAAMTGALEEAGITWNDVHFIPYGESETEYIPNERKTTQITVHKIWHDSGGGTLQGADLPPSVTVTLEYKAGENGVFQTYDLDETTKAKVQLTAQGNWSYTWNNLPKKNKEGTAYYYRVKEETVPEDFTVTYNYPKEGSQATGVLEGTITLINTKESSFVLPETGGFGPLQFAIAGLPLVGASGVVYLKQRRKRRRGGKTP